MRKKATSAPSPARANRLAAESSPYLLQHAHNPVDWYPWGAEAFARARREDKPVFLSLGYSTCHWCHVMERESFENEEVAAVLNADFVSIKVDREERPELDEYFMTVTQLLTGSGGWPNQVWLTPDGRPWYAGTYFPPEDRGGRPGLKGLLRQLAAAWKERRAEVEEQANRIRDAVARTQSEAGAPPGWPLSRDLVAQTMRALEQSCDPRFGGFGGAPKFPPHAALRLLLYERRQRGGERALEMLTATLDAMARGGIRDHVGGGFHRYATDERWFLPHFEKMLYDNALLARAYAEAHTATKRREYRRAAKETLDWALREMRAPEGAFQSACDADSEGAEGKYYVWTAQEIAAALPSESAALFAHVYGIEKEGNFRDEASGRPTGLNIPYLRAFPEELAAAEGLDPEETRRTLDAARAKLLAERVRRVHPRQDDKALTDWNGLMIGALAFAGKEFACERYLDAARGAADFLFTRCRQGGGLLHSWRTGKGSIPGYLDDYAFLADGLLDLHAATGEARWLEWARPLAETLQSRFQDRERGGFYFTSAEHEALPVRAREPFDRATPSGNGVAARVLVRLSALTGEPAWAQEAARCIRSFMPLIAQAPQAAPSLALAAAMLLDQSGQGQKQASAPVPHRLSQE